MSSVSVISLGTQVTGLPLTAPPSVTFPEGTPATGLLTVPIINGQPPPESEATLPLNSWVSDPPQEYILVFDSNGLCLYQVFGSGNNVQNGGSFQGVAIWGPVGAGGQYFCAQSDGNLVVYNAKGTAIWASGSSGTAQFLFIQSDSNVVVYHLAANWSWKSP